jgi:ribonuclease BN (tRNA processing enzyme)
LEIKFIGTGSAVTSLKRFHSSFLINSENYRLLVDAGDGISKALLTRKIPYNSINGLLITHLHPDHFSGLALLIIQMKLFKRKRNLQIFVHKSLKDEVRNFLEKSYIFLDQLGFKLDLIGFKNDDEKIVHKNLTFLARNNSHLKSYEKFDKNRLSFSCSSFLFKENEKNLFYTGDIGSRKDLNIFSDHKLNFIISEITHIKLEDILKAFTKLKFQKLIFTHISDNDSQKISDFFRGLSPQNRKRILAAKDGYSFKV